MEAGVIYWRMGGMWRRAKTPNNSQHHQTDMWDLQSPLPLAKSSHMSEARENQQNYPVDPYNHQKWWIIAVLSHKVLGWFVMQQSKTDTHLLALLQFLTIYKSVTSNKKKQSLAPPDCQLVGWHHSPAECLRHSHQPPLWALFGHFL